MGPHGIDDGRGTAPLPQTRRRLLLAGFWISVLAAIACLATSFHLRDVYARTRPAAPDPGAGYVAEFRDHALVSYVTPTEKWRVEGPFFGFCALLLSAGVCSKKLGWGTAQSRR
jgi:hypothetical protein